MATRTALPCPPLYGTPRSPERPTLGGQVAAIAARLGKPLMPHQRYIVDVVLELDPETGLLPYSEVVVIGPRQATGKTELLLPVMTHRCVGFGPELTAWVRRELGIALPAPGPQTVIYTAQTADDARKKWRDVHVKRLQASYYRRQFTPRLRQNFEAMDWRNGSMWSPASTTGKTAGTGDTIDLPVIDEAWSRPDARTELGMRPASMTRVWRQLWVLSMIPGLSRALPGTWPYLAHKRQVGRARVEAGVRYGTAFFDFSAADGLDPADPQTWWSCMPGLGRTVTERAVREDFDAMDLVDFCAEYLGWAPLERKPRWTLLPEEVWRKLRDPSSSIVGRPALSIEMPEDRSTAWIVSAGRRADGHSHVEVVEPGARIAQGVPGVEWVLPRALDIYEDNDAYGFVIDPRRPAASLITSLRNRGIPVLTPVQHEIAGACGRFYDATGAETFAAGGGEQELELLARRVFHLGQPELDRAVAGAKPLDVGNGAFVFVKKGSSAEICTLYGATLAMHGLDVWDPDDYDLAESVDSSRPCERCGRQVYVHDGSWLHCEDDSPEC